MWWAAMRRPSLDQLVEQPVLKDDVSDERGRRRTVPGGRRSWYDDSRPSGAAAIMAANLPRAYLVGSVELRDRLIAELAAIGITAVAGRGVPGAGQKRVKDGPRLVFVRGEPIPYGVVLTALRRCHHHRHRNEALTRRGPMLDGSVKLCAVCRDAAPAYWAAARARAK